jgi:hypothetical protein
VITRKTIRYWPAVTVPAYLDQQPRKWIGPVLVLAIGSFAMGTDSFVLAGILPQLAHGLQVTRLAPRRIPPTGSNAFSRNSAGSPQTGATARPA